MFLCDNMAFYSFVWIKRISEKNKTLKYQIFICLNI
jgi:hypothetical protein